MHGDAFFSRIATSMNFTNNKGPTMSDKATLRTALLATRSAISDDQRQQWNARIAAQVLQRVEEGGITSLGIFWPLRGEPDLQALYVVLAELGVDLALPVVDGPTLPLRFVAWAPGAALTRDAMGVQVPVQGASLKPQALLVPCLGFTPARLRLGYGGGFYDRTLATTPRPQTIGIAYACGSCDFPSEPHDVALDEIVTERS